MATRPRVRMSTRPVTVVSLRICCHPSAAPTRPDATPAAASRVESSNPGGGKGREHSAGASQNLPCIPQASCGPDRRQAQPRPHRRRAVTHNPAKGGKSPNQARHVIVADDLKAAAVPSQKVTEDVSANCGNGHAAASIVPPTSYLPAESGRPFHMTFRRPAVRPGTCTSSSTRRSGPASTTSTSTGSSP